MDCCPPTRFVSALCLCGLLLLLHPSYTKYTTGQLRLEVAAGEGSGSFIPLLGRRGKLLFQWGIRVGMDGDYI